MGSHNFDNNINVSHFPILVEKNIVLKKNIMMKDIIMRSITWGYEENYVEYFIGKNSL